MKLLLSKLIKDKSCGLVVPKKLAEEWKMDKPIFDEEALKRLLDWTITDYNVTYNGYTFAVVEMTVTPSKNICGRVILAEGIYLFLAIDKVDEPKVDSMGAGTEKYYTCLSPYCFGPFKDLGAACSSLREDQMIVSALLSINLNTTITYKLTVDDISLISDVCPDAWVSLQHDSTLRIPMGALGSPTSLQIFEKLGINVETKVIYQSDNEIVKDETSYFTFGDLVGCVEKWLLGSLIRQGNMKFVPGPASDFEGDKLTDLGSWYKEIPFDHVKFLNDRHHQYPHPLYKRDRTFGDAINPTLRGVNKSMPSLDFISMTHNRTYLLKLIPSTLVKKGAWYLADFEPIIVCQNNEHFSRQFVNDIVKRILSYLGHTDMHYVVSLGDDPKSDANVKVVVELNESKATQSNISLRFTTNAPLAGAEDLLTSHPENFAFKLLPHLGDAIGYWNRFGSMFLVDLNKPLTIPCSGEPGGRSETLLHDGGAFPRSTKRELLELNPHAGKSIGDVYDAQQHALWLNFNMLNGSTGSEKMRQLRFDKKTMSLWLEFCDQISTDMVVNPTVDVKQTFLDMVIKSLESSIRTSSEDPESSAFFTKNPVSQLQRFGRLPLHREAYKAGVKATIDRALSPFENLFDNKEYISPSYSLVKVKDGQVYSENADVDLDELKLEDGDYMMRKLDSNRLEKFKESLQGLSGVSKPGEKLIKKLINNPPSVNVPTDAQGNVADLVMDDDYPTNPWRQDYLKEDKLFEPKIVKIQDDKILDSNDRPLPLQNGWYELHLKHYSPPEITRDNTPLQVIEVNYGVIVSDSLNHLVGLKIDLESGTWTRHTDGGDWIKSE